MPNADLSSNNTRRSSSTMVIASVTELSDEETQPHGSPAVPAVAPGDPPATAKSKPKAAAKGSPKAKAKTLPKKKASSPKQEQVPVPEDTGGAKTTQEVRTLPEASENKTLKRPAASGSTQVMKRPSCAPWTVSKSMYQRDGVWGIKLNRLNKEILRVGVETNKALKIYYYY